MISAIVMAAGKGTRMQSDKAKTLHEILGKPMIEYTYDTLEKLGVENKVFVVGHGAEQLQAQLKDRVEYAMQMPQHGTGHAVMQATQLKGLSGKTLIINGDCPLITVDTYNKLLEMADKYQLVILSTILDNAGNYGRVIRDEAGEVLAIVEKKDCNEEQLKVNEINAGIYCVDNELLWQCLPEIDNNNAQNEYYVTDLVKIFKKHGYSVGAYNQADKNELAGINSRAELIESTKWLQCKINKNWINNGVTIINPENTYIGPDVEIEKDVIIYPNCRIEGKTTIGTGCIIEEGSFLKNAKIGENNDIICCRITDSTVGNNNNIGPNAHLRNNVKIGNDCRIGNYVEMKNVVFGNGSKCAHLTYLGDVTVGEKCNFGCGVVTVNYDGKNKFHSTIGNHCFIGSNVNIISPVNIADTTVLAAGTTVTKDVLEGDMAIGRVRQENKPGYGAKYLNK